MKPTKAKTRREIRRLRKFIDTSKDDIAVRIAYAIEEALIWATKETIGWGTPLKIAKENAEILKKVELKNYVNHRP